MTWPFLDRKDELARLKRALAAGGGRLVVVYGRRRCGKSRLIQEVIKPGDVYHLADQSESELQRASLAEDVSRSIPDAGNVSYPSWQALLTHSEKLAPGRLNVFIDEFPYLVERSPELPSVIQRLLDMPGAKRINYVLSGSSQRMMHGLVLDASAPLYGRASEIIKIEPLKAGWIREAFGCSAEAGVEAYSVWGGVPRYWELAGQFGSLESAVKDTVLSGNGILQDEPMRLLTDDMRSAVQPFSILTTIGAGCSRLSEIAGRLQRPLNALSRPLSNLVDLGYVRRDVPWGESEKTTRRSSYRIADPFLGFYFRFVRSARSLISAGMADDVWLDIEKALPAHTGLIWEQMARDSVSQLRISGTRWKPASRWWGAGKDNRPLEIDIVAESVDGSSLLVGEAKWNRKPDVDRMAEELASKLLRIPFAGNRRLVPVVWVRSGKTTVKGMDVVDPERALDALK